MKLSLPVNSGFYKSDSPGLSQRECTNLYPSTPMEGGASSGGGLFSYPGRKDWVDFNYVAGATHIFKGELYVATTSALIKIAEDGTETNLGAFATSGLFPQAIMDDNGETLCIVWPTVGISYFYDPTNGLVQITDSVFQGYEAESGGVRSVAFVGGYFVFNTYESIFISSLVTTNLGQNFDALDNVKPFLREKAQRVLNVRGELYVFGENISKPYSDIGGADFPFIEVPGAVIDKGVETAFSVVSFDNAYFFIGGGKNEAKAVWRGLGGGGVTKISTDSIDSHPIGADAVGAQKVASAFMFHGRPFIGFVVVDAIFYYDVLSSSIMGYPVWFQTTYDMAAVYTFEAYNKIYSIINDKIMELDSSNESERGAAFTFSSPYLESQADGISINRLELQADCGVGLNPNTSISSNDPQVKLEVSTDGGNTFVDRGERSIGRYQKYTKRLVWNRLNWTPNDAIFRFSTTTGVPVRFHRIDIDFVKGQRNG